MFWTVSKWCLYCQVHFFLNTPNAYHLAPNSWEDSSDQNHVCYVKGILESWNNKVFFETPPHEICYESPFLGD